MQAKIFFGSEEVTKDEWIEIKNPFKEKIVSMYPKCDENDAKKALLVAKEAFKQTKNSTLNQRIKWLEDVANKLEEKKDEFAKTITNEVGKPIKFSIIEVERCIETIKLTISAAIELNGETFNSDAMPSGKKTISLYKRVPCGVVVAITPFNFPLNLVAHKIVPALAVGNTVVLKPTPEAPLIAYKFTKLFIQSEFAIKDALSIVYGDSKVGSTLVSSEIPRVISFTGSVAVGKIITKNAGIKKVALELGGNAATFIEKSSDIKEAALKCAAAAFYNSGQVCISLQRIYVQDEVYKEFAKLLVEETNKLIIGDPYEKDTFVGPLINQEAINRAKNWVKSAIEEGAKVLCGNKAEDKVFYPTVMGNVKDDMMIICEEVFAPIVSLIRVKDFDEAVKKINNSPYGLQYSIFTNDLNLTKRAIDEFECGGVVVNDIPTLRFDIQPYGGVKLSGTSREGPKFALEEFSDIKSVVIC